VITFPLRGLKCLNARYVASLSVSCYSMYPVFVFSEPPPLFTFLSCPALSLRMLLPHPVVSSP
jgi:hypothetical protein